MAGNRPCPTDICSVCEPGFCRGNQCQICADGRSFYASLRSAIDKEQRSSDYTENRARNLNRAGQGGTEGVDW